VGKHSGVGWLQVICPFCSGKFGYYGGFNLKNDYYNCWRCGYHNFNNVLAQLLELKYYEIETLLKDYETHQIITQKRTKIKKKIEKVELPINSKYPIKRHFDYLLKRGFDDIEKLINEWNILGTDHLSDYRNRLVFPIIFENKIVSFQTRDIIGKSDLKYIACPEDKEIIHHKHLLYGLDKIENKCIILEGIFDVLKFGIGAVSTFGTGFKKEQVDLLINKNINEIYILFDKEEQAQIQAEKLALGLKPFVDHVEILSLNINKNDVGDMSLVEIKELRKLLNF
jgi:hypothetical protein